MPDIRRKNGRITFSLDLLIATVPLLVWSAAVQGMRVASLVIVSVAASLLTDLALSLIKKEKRPLLDLTALVTGTAVPLFFSAAAPAHQVAVGAAVAVFTLRMINAYSPVRTSPVLFGAAAARLIFGPEGFVPYGEKAPFSFAPYNGSVLGEIPEITQIRTDGLPDAGTASLFFGGRAGLVGDTAIMLLAVAFIWLCAGRHRRPGAPLIFLGASFALFYAFPEVAIESDIISLQHAAGMLLSAPYMLAAVFVTGDPAILPHSPTGRLISGAAAAGIAFLSAKYVSVWYAPLIGALAAPLLSFPLDLIFGGDSVFGGRYSPPKAKAAPEAGETPDGEPEEKESAPGKQAGSAGNIDAANKPEGSENVVDDGNDRADGDENSGDDEHVPYVEDFSVFDKVD